MDLPHHPAKRLIAALVVAAATGCASRSAVPVAGEPLSSEENAGVARVYQRKGWEAQARDRYRLALEQNPENVDALIALGNYAFQRDKFAEAERYYEGARRAAPENPVVNHNLALLFLERGTNLSEAERLALKAAERPTWVRPYALLTVAKIRGRFGQIDRALSALERATAATPDENVSLRAALKKVELRLRAKGS